MPDYVFTSMGIYLFSSVSPNNKTCLSRLLQWPENSSQSNNMLTHFLLKPKTMLEMTGKHSMERHLIAADGYLLSGDLEKARQQTVLAWFIAPRSRRVNFLLSRVFEGDERVLGRYVAVESFIFENSALRESVVATIEQPLRFTPDELRAQLSDLKARYVSMDQRTRFEYWQTFAPFEIEYLCLGLLKACGPEVAGDALELYSAYGMSLNSISEEQKMHSRTFLLQLLNLVPEAKTQRPLYLLE